MGAVDAVHSNGFSDDEAAAVRSKYPRLILVQSHLLEGTLELHASFNDHVITDEFLIRITASAEYPGRMPTMREIGERTQSIASKYRITDFRKLHRSGDEAACLCVKQMERKKFPPGSDLFVFVENLVVPYLYGLSYYDATGRWPWGEYTHGALGLLEFYGDDGIEQTREGIEEVALLIRRETNWKEYHKQIRKPSGDRMCLCGSMRSFKTCHRRAWEGTLRLNSELRRLRLRQFT